MPSEAEWEYAARAGTTTEYALPAPNGSGSSFQLVERPAEHGIAGLANCGEGVGGRTTPVGQFPTNAWGLYDVHGNVWEWVEDCNHGNYEGAPDDGRAWLEGNGGNCNVRMLRGGSWFDTCAAARSFTRMKARPDYRDVVIGFRVVCSSPSSGPDN